MTIVVAQYFVGRRTANSFASECSSYFSMQTWRSSPFLQSAISTAGLVVLSFQQVQAHSSPPGARMQAIFLPTVCSTLRRNRSLSLFNFILFSVFNCLDSCLFGFHAAELLQTGLTGLRDSILGLAVDRLDLVRGAQRLPGGVEGAFAA